MRTVGRDGRNGTDAGPTGASAPDSFAEFYLRSGYGAFEQEHRHGGSFGMTMIEIDQGAIETTDPAVDETVFVSTRSAASFEYDFGDGWRRGRATARTVDVQPAFQACGFRLPPMGLRLVTVKADALASLLDEAGASPAALDAVTGRFVELAGASALVDELWEAMSRQGMASTLLTDGLFMRLVGELLAAAGNAAAPGDAGRAPSRAGEPRFGRVREYVEANLADALTVAELAEVAGMSRSGFVRAFRTAHGTALWSYVEGRRAARAVALLRGGRLPIECVAKRCGLVSTGHLTVVLRRHFGTTPEAVRDA